MSTNTFEKLNEEKICTIENDNGTKVITVSSYELKTSNGNNIKLFEIHSRQAKYNKTRNVEEIKKNTVTFKADEFALLKNALSN